MVGIVTGDVLEARTAGFEHRDDIMQSVSLEACFADRFFGNRRIAQKIRHSTALARAVLWLGRMEAWRAA